MFPVKKQRLRKSQMVSRSRGLTWDSMRWPTSPNHRFLAFPRILPMDDPKWILTWELVENIIDYEFKNPDLLREAMYPVQTGWARIVGSNRDRTFEEGNRRLAHIGDTVLKTMAVDTWFWRMLKVEQLHNELQHYHTNDAMNGLAQKKGISAIMKFWFSNGVIEGKKTEATTMEAIIGAVWYDSGNDLHTIRTLLDRLLSTNLVAEHAAHYPILD